MTFFQRQGWQVQFLEADLRTPLPGKLTFTDAKKIRELAKKGEGMGRFRKPADVRACDRDWQRRGLPEAHARSIREAEAALSYSWRC
jgi:hypothetical protein